jgi:hypothetical protein
MNSDSLRGEAMSNSKIRLKTTKGKFIVCFNGLELLALNYGLRHATLSVQGGLWDNQKDVNKRQT